MNLNFSPVKRKIAVSVIVCALLFLGYLYGIPLWVKATRYYNLFIDSEQIKTLITSFGPGAPLVFVTIQILQVLFAPIPGEVTGLVGGYLFGAAKGFLYSSIGLTLGSWINFIIGRFFGKRYVRKLVPAVYLKRFDTIIQHQGIIVIFLLFVFPGFPKDYLCLFLGLSAIPIKTFIILVTIGRMPGTFILSLQGAFLFDQVYIMFAFIAGVCLVISLFAYRYRRGLYQWVERTSSRK